MNILYVLNEKGDTDIKWDTADPASVAEARKTVEDLARMGYSFFLVDGTPADAVAAGNGMLLVRRVASEELLSGTDAPPAAESKGKPGRKAVAVRQQRGG